MPQRTNEFQNLIFLLERQLAPQRATVVESYMVEDRSGAMRELDVAIMVDVGGHSIVVGVECIDHSRPAAVTWIDGLIGKYRDLKVNKVVAVSRSGFTKNAAKKALDANIDTLTLEEATQLDWARVVDALSQITVVTFLRPYATGVTLLLEEQGDANAFGLDPATAELRGPSGENRGKLQDIVDAILADDAFLKAAEDNAYTDAGSILELEYRFPAGSYVKESHWY